MPSYEEFFSYLAIELRKLRKLKMTVAPVSIGAIDPKIPLGQCLDKLKIKRILGSIQM